MRSPWDRLTTVSTYGPSGSEEDDEPDFSWDFSRLGKAATGFQGIQHRIADDVRVRPPPVSSGVGQNLTAAAMLLRAMPEPSTTKGRRIQGELKNLLEDAAVRRAESSASRRQGYPSEHRAATS
jgi:hypothetical protein